MIGNAALAVYPDERPSMAGVDDVTPPREIRSTDVSKLSFPFQIVIAIAVSAVSASATIWAVQRNTETAIASMQSDIRDVLTRMEAQTKLDEANRRLADLQTNNMKESIDDLGNRVKLMELQYTQLAKEIIQGRR